MISGKAFSVFVRTLRGCQEMPFVGAYFLVIPGWSAGPGPEPMNTGHSRVGRGLCSWVPGSRAAPEPRNDGYSGFPDSLDSGHDEGRIGSHHYESQSSVSSYSPASS